MNGFSSFNGFRDLNRVLFFIVCFLLSQVSWSLAEVSSFEEIQADFYISTQGSDAWSGSLAEPNADGSDGPFASLDRARVAVRELKDKFKAEQKLENGNGSGIVVLIRSGVYTLDETVVFGLEDSGSAGCTISYEAYPGEVPVFSSAKRVNNWVKLVDIKDEDGGEAADTAPKRLSKSARRHVLVADVTEQFYTLYDEQGLLPRARSKGFIPLEKSSSTNLFAPKGILKNWGNTEDMEVVVRPNHAWLVNILPIESVKLSKNLAKTTVRATYGMNPLHFLKDTESCWIENALEFLDEPGEWVLDTSKGKLYMWPRLKGAVAEDLEILAPTLRELVLVEGVIHEGNKADEPVRNLIFRGLTFKHGDRYTVRKDDGGLQHDWDLYDRDNALLRLRGTQDCVVDQCHFLHSGGGAVRVDLHGIGTQITNNHIEHIGSTGVLLAGYGPGTKDVNKGNVISNNHIHHVGEVYNHAPGIFVWQSGGNHVVNNLIHHTPYTALILSGCMTDFFVKSWGRELVPTLRKDEIGELPEKPIIDDVLPFLHTHDNVVEYNEIHHAMEKLADGNAIYIRGAGLANVIRRNYIHDLLAPTVMQSAIRTDGGQTGTMIAENVIYRCTSQGIKLKLNNHCENNIIVDIIPANLSNYNVKKPKSSVRCNYLSLREGPMRGATFKRNICYSSEEDVTFISAPRSDSVKTEDYRGRELARLEDIDVEYNIYFSTVNANFGTVVLKENRARGADEKSLAKNPLFMDVAKADFRLSPDSPARKLGIISLDVSKMGLKDKALDNSEVD